MKGKPMPEKKMQGMTIKGKPAPMPTRRKKKKTLAEHTRSLKAAVKY